MNNKVILNIIIVYFVILCVVLCFQLAKEGNKVSAPSTSEQVTGEDRLDNAIVLCQGSPVLLVNKQQTLLDRTDSSLVPTIKGEVVYVPISFFKTVYNASVTSTHSDASATIRLQGKALVFSDNNVMLIDNSKEKSVNTSYQTYWENGNVYVPLNVFAEAFGKYLYYYDGMVIVADEKDVFGNEEPTFIAGLRSQVNDLPYVTNEQNLTELCNVSNNELGKMVGNAVEQFESKDNTQPVALMKGSSDVIKSDDNYIYRAGTGKVDIVKYKTESGVPEQVASIKLEAGFEPTYMYLNGSTLAVIGNVSSTADNTSEVATQEQTDTASDDNQVAPMDKYVELCIYDVADTANVKQVRSLRLDGYFLSASQSGDYIYLLARSAIYDNFENGHLVPPAYIDSTRGEDEQPLSFDTMQYFPEMGGKSYTIVGAVNIADSEQNASVKAYLCAGQKVYLSGSNLFVARDRYTAFEGDKKVENSHIYKLSLLGGNIGVTAHSSIKGYILDANGMDEDMGYLRIVSSYKSTKNDDIENIYIMNNNLELCGQANKVAEGADIKSALFTKDKLYLVPDTTGKPTYIVDLSDPLMPTGNGVLRFSEGRAMLYPYDEDNIMVLDNGGGKLKLRLIRINGKDEPVQLFSEELGGDNISSSVFSNSGLFYYDNSRNTFALPITIKSGDVVSFSGSYIYSVNTDEGFKRLGASTSTGDNGIVRLGNVVYLFSDKSLTYTPVTDITQAQTIELN
jgi:hypothetical protein